MLVRRVGAEAAGDVLAVVRAAFAAPAGPRPARGRAGRDGGDGRGRARGVRRAAGHASTTDRSARCSSSPRPEACYLRRFGVVPDAQGHGVAAALVEAARRPPRSAHACVGVLAREELPATIGFWERHGFREADRRSPYVELRRAAAHDLRRPGRGHDA